MYSGKQEIQECFQQWHYHPMKCLPSEGEDFEGDNQPIVTATFAFTEWELNYHRGRDDD